MHPGQRLQPGARVIFERDGLTLHAEVLDAPVSGPATRPALDRATAADVDAVVDAIGHMPLPPYITRDDAQRDRERYQTVFARDAGRWRRRRRGSISTAALLAALDARGVERGEVTLHVGYGTFKPVRVERVEEHRVDAERYEVSAAAAPRSTPRSIADAASSPSARRRRARSKASASRTMDAWSRRAGSTDLFIHPGFTVSGWSAACSRTSTCRARRC